jgi:hypothetical protein
VGHIVGKNLEGGSYQVSGNAIAPTGGPSVSIGVGNRSLTGIGVGAGPGWGLEGSLSFDTCQIVINTAACKNTPCECKQ